MILTKKSPPLDLDRVTEIREQIDQYIDARVAMLGKTFPGVPEHVIRNNLTARASGCQCETYSLLSASDLADAESVARAKAEAKAAKV